MKIGAFILLILMFGCSKKLSPASYLDYVKKNPGDFSIEMESGAKYKLQLVTPENVLAENMEGLSKKEAKAELQKMKDHPISAFKLQLLVENGTLFSQNSADKSEQMEYYSVGFRKQILAITNKLDTVTCEGYIFEAGAGFGPSSHFEFYFPSEIKEYKEVIIYPKYLESQKLSFDLTSLHREYPELRIRK